MQLKIDREFRVYLQSGKESRVFARTHSEALSIALRRGRFGLGAGWRFSRQPDGWVLGVNTSMKNLEREKYRYKIREVEYSRA
jgi:hypothetical protein